MRSRGRSGLRSFAGPTAAAGALTAWMRCVNCRKSRHFADVMATSQETVLLTGEFAPESFGGVLLSGNAFNFLGVPPVAGRTIQPSDIRPDGLAEPVVVLSHRLWLRLFDGDSVGHRPDAAAQRPAAHHHRRDAAAIRLDGNDGFWLPLASGPNRSCIRQSDHASGAWRLAGCGRGTAEGIPSTPGEGEALHFSASRVSRPAEELSRRDRGQRRNARPAFSSCSAPSGSSC